MADLARSACHVSAWASDADVIDARFIGLTSNRTASCILAETIKTCLLSRARYIGTAEDTFTITTEAVFATLDARAWVGFTARGYAALPIGASSPRAMIYTTLAGIADLAVRTLNVST